MAKEHPVISRQREEKIIELAEMIGEEHQSKHGGTALEAILHEKEITLCFEDYDDPFDGLIIFDEGRFFIHCNRRTGNREGTTRSRFTIAHELGHFFIDEHRNFLKNNEMPSLGERAKGDVPIEREADLFASRLLLPSSIYRNALKKADEGLKGIVTLADRFGVSVKCSSLRYLSEDPVSCCLAFWTWEETLAWKWYSKSLWNAGARKMKSAPVARGATSITIGKGSTEIATIEQTCAPTNYLFQLSDGAHYHAIFHEEAISLGEYGVLSLLRAKDGHLKPLAEILDQRMERLHA